VLRFEILVSAAHNVLAAVRERADNCRSAESLWKPSLSGRRHWNEGADMSDVWDTKDGRRRVRRDPPTIEEAVVAAQGLTDDLKEKTEIVASLMEVPFEEARSAVLRMGQSKDVSRVTITAPVGRTGAARAVVVERRAPRYTAVQRRSGSR
jgi:hypothetical protein